MILADTSVWVEHFRTGNQRLAELLAEAQVVTHPFVVGELACGSLQNRRIVLDLLAELPTATVASHEEALRFLEAHRLWAKGIGWLDIHLLAAARLSRCPLWTLDRRLATVAAGLRLRG